jgi:hypothetical protein
MVCLDCYIEINSLSCLKDKKVFEEGKDLKEKKISDGYRLVLWSCALVFKALIVGKVLGTNLQGLPHRHS